MWIEDEMLSFEELNRFTKASEKSNLEIVMSEIEIEVIVERPGS